jgi:hypothetical protein
MTASTVVPDFNVLRSTKRGDRITIRFKGDSPAEEVAAVLNLVYSNVLDLGDRAHAHLKRVIVHGWEGMFAERRVTLFANRQWNRELFERTLRPYIDSLQVQPL